MPLHYEDSEAATEGLTYKVYGISGIKDAVNASSTMPAIKNAIMNTKISFFIIAMPLIYLGKLDLA
ncbi:MAG: hypothetical protein HZA07_02575 [Nitrospirae bacterium]|nr:hypothetical protein [Nitrospirota bacterium]